jgi:hypothetical protein
LVGCEGEERKIVTIDVVADIEVTRETCPCKVVFLPAAIGSLGINQEIDPPAEGGSVSSTGGNEP